MINLRERLNEIRSTVRSGDVTAVTLESLHAERNKIYRVAVRRAKLLLTPRCRIGVRRFPAGHKVQFIFHEWDGEFIVSASGYSDIHPVNIYALNGKPVDFLSAVEGLSDD